MRNFLDDKIHRLLFEPLNAADRRIKMKVKNLKRFLSILLTTSIIITTSFIFGFENATAEENYSRDIVWNFEDGKLSPFKLVNGAYGTVISSIPYDHHSSDAAY